MKDWMRVVCTGLLTVLAVTAQAVVIPVSKAVLNPDNAELTAVGAGIRTGGKCGIGKTGAAPDLVFAVRVPAPGLYILRTETCVDKAGAELMHRSRNKFDSMAAQFQIDDGRPTSRYIFVPWSKPDFCRQTPGKFYFRGDEQKLKIWLPEHCFLKKIQLDPYRPQAVPKEAQNYVPRYTPPKSHPRLWMRAADLPRIKANLTCPEHLPYWQALQKEAKRPFKFKFDPAKEVKFNSALEKAVTRKAFYFQMTGDRKVGDEAVRLTKQYMELVEFGNLLDITREIGWAIYASACVYDWCYDIMTVADRDSIRKNMMRLARDMECAWPPFRQGIVNGHGNELQINRDLLSMSIAIYDEDPVPYKYCSYLILEKLVPMRKFEYRSPRHNQGVSYGSFRFPCDLRSATLFRQMLGHEVFDPNIKNVPLFWLYMRAPGGTMLRDGDGMPPYNYWKAPDLMFMCSVYSGNPLVKGEFKRQVPGRYHNSVLFLILNDPAVKPEYALDSLPLSIDFGPVLSGMIARTGWRIGEGSSDVAAEIKGGGFHFGNHQHADAGSFQIWYKGFLAAKLGVYHYYGTPYDMNFCKRSVSQPMMLVLDPKEDFRYGKCNDGGSRFFQSHPGTPAQAEKQFRYGKKLYCSFGPSAKRPLYSSFAADLTGAYSGKITSYVRTFHFFNTGDKKLPAVILVTDNVTAKDPSFKKTWQINTLEMPQTVRNGAVLRSPGGGALHLFMPVPARKTMQVLSGRDVYKVDGVQLAPPPRWSVMPETRGHRILFSPEKAAACDRFLAVMQIADAGVKPPAVHTLETAHTYVVQFRDWYAVLNKETALLNQPFEFTAKAQSRILAAGLAAGPWTVTGPEGVFYTEVKSGGNTVFLTGPAGKYTFAPGKIAGARLLPDHSRLQPPAEPVIPAGSVVMDDRILPGVSIRMENSRMLISAGALLKHFGISGVSDRDGFLKVPFGGAQWVFYLDSGDWTRNGVRSTAPAASRKIGSEWFIPAEAAGALLNLNIHYDIIGRNAVIKRK